VPATTPTVSALWHVAATRFVNRERYFVGPCERCPVGTPVALRRSFGREVHPESTAELEAVQRGAVFLAPRGNLHQAGAIPVIPVLRRLDVSGARPPEHHDEVTVLHVGGIDELWANDASPTRIGWVLFGPADRRELETAWCFEDEARLRPDAVVRAHHP